MVLSERLAHFTPSWRALQEGVKKAPGERKR
jgi:hypothetical protein